MTMKLRRLLLGAVVLGALSSSSALAQTASYSLVWDDFKGGFSAGTAESKWFHIQAGPYITNDATTTILSNGLRVASPGRNPVTGKPAFTITLGQEDDNGGIPSTNDHAKFLAYMNHGATSGYPGFDTLAGEEFACSTRISGQTFGTEAHPFGDKVESSHDLRLSAFALATIDVESWMVFDFFFTNNRIYAFYERLPFGKSATNNYAAFSYAIPVKYRNKDSVHDVSIAYNRSAGTVRWIVDGQEVYRVSQVGHRLASRKNMLIDLGGENQTVTLNQLDCGMALFTLLDGAMGSKPGLVRLSSSGPYYSPAMGEPTPLTFLDESSEAGSRLFGQGAEFRIGEYRVSSTAVSAPPPAPVYTEPAPLAGDSVDGAPNTSPLP